MDIGSVFGSYNRSGTDPAVSQMHKVIFQQQDFISSCAWWFPGTADVFLMIRWHTVILVLILASNWASYCKHQVLPLLFSTRYWFSLGQKKGHMLSLYWSLKYCIQPFFQPELSVLHQVCASSDGLQNSENELVTLRCVRRSDLCLSPVTEEIKPVLFLSVFPSQVPWLFTSTGGQQRGRF